ncbi:hypothetical protein UY3_15673 [Chelonia mydas]|uniref:Uncharacterized protein n=1 Tax=Chelonia mydas TaxID=8469 RepID=M7APN6_CHEMY|nr:hypothetical protein UY3_15673 [Chelonia mydas]
MTGVKRGPEREQFRSIARGLRDGVPASGPTNGTLLFVTDPQDRVVMQLGQETVPRALQQPSPVGLGSDELPEAEEPVPSVAPGLCRSGAEDPERLKDPPPKCRQRTAGPPG